MGTSLLSFLKGRLIVLRVCAMTGSGCFYSVLVWGMDCASFAVLCLKSGPGWSYHPPAFHKPNNFYLSEVPAPCQHPHPEGVHRPMREQKSRQREGVIKALMVEITLLMEGRAYWINSKEGNRGHSKQCGQDVQSLLYKYVPSSKVSDSLAAPPQRHRDRADSL